MSKLDREIDRAVREMLDVEPPAGLRGRVLDRIEQPRRGFAWIWIAGPVAAAAVIVLALILPRTDPSATKPVATIATAQPGPAATPAQPAPRVAVTPPPQTVTAQRVTRPSAGRQRPIRAAAVEDTSADIVWVDPLAGPAAIAVAPMGPVPAPVLPSIELAPAQIPALEVRPISDTPRERRNQE